MATQDVEGSIAPTGDVVDFVIEIDNPTGFITPFGGVTLQVDSTTIVELAGGITPSGELSVVSPVQCFPTDYTCIESNAVDYTCIGACETDTPIVPEELVLEGIIIPVGQLIETPCAPVVECPPIIGSECNEILRILQEKVLAWHIASCGIVLGSDGGSGLVVHESFEDYDNLTDMEDNDWTFIDEMVPGGAAGDGFMSVGTDPDAYDGTKTFKMTTSGAGPLAPGSRLRATKIFGGAHGLLADEPYVISARGKMDIKSSFDVHSRLSVAGATTEIRAITGAGIGAFMIVGPVAVTSTALAQLTIYLERTNAFVVQNRQIWWDDIRIEGATAIGIEQWLDMSGNLNHLTRILSTAKATQNGPTLNGVVTLAFTGGAYLEWPVGLLLGTENLEAFMVVKTTSGSGLWRIGADEASPTLFPDSVSGKLLENFASQSRVDFGAPIVDPTSTFRLYHVRTDGSNLNASLDNILQAGPLSHVYSTSTAPVFGRSDEDTPGSLAVAEVIITTALTEDERASTIAILSDRWALGL